MEPEKSLKGLNVPTFNRKTDLDNAFSDLSIFLEINDEIKDDALTQLYNRAQPHTDQIIDETSKIETIMEFCFESLIRIQDLSIAKQLQQRTNSTDPEKSNLVSISLHDMNHLNDLINVIVAQVIYPCLPPGSYIPLDKRRLKSFTVERKIFRYKPEKNVSRGVDILKKVIANFKGIFSKDGDLKELLMKGSGLTDIITSLLILNQIHQDSKDYLHDLELFESYSDSYILFGIYITLLEYTSIPPLKLSIIERLNTTMIDRPNGIVSLIDFIMGIREEEDIEIERYNQVNMVLMSKPRNISSVEYYSRIFDQVYQILVFINRPVLVSSITNYLRVLYERNRRIVQDFLFKRITKTLVPLKNENSSFIVAKKEFNDVINVLISLNKECSAEFLLDLFQNDIILNLWTYYLYLSKKNMDYKKIIQNVLVSYFTTTMDNARLEIVMMNLARTKLEVGEFRTDLETGLTAIIKSCPTDLQGLTYDEIFDDIDSGLKVMIELLKELPEEMVKAQFINVLNRWILSTQKSENKLGDEEPNAFLMLIDLKLIDLMNTEFKDLLMEKPHDLLVVVKNLLSTRMLENESSMEKNEEEEQKVDSDSDDEDDDDRINQIEDGSDAGLGILLELLSAILSETETNELLRQSNILKEISTNLLSFESNLQCQSLSVRIIELLNENNDTNITQVTQYEEDKALMRSAINNLNDPLVPIRAHGLYQLRILIQRKSEFITLDFVINLHLVQLKDQDPFIYLNVIKSLIEMINFDEKETLSVLIDLYSNEAEDLDERLKIGEVLLNFISNTNELLNGEIVDKMITTFLKIIRSVAKEDNRIRMSAMSLLGHSMRVNALSLQSFIGDSLDMSIGILEFEKDLTMLRSAIVLVSDLISFGGLEIIPKSYVKKLQTIMEFVKVNNYKDLLLVEMISKVIDTVEELIKDKFKLEDSTGSSFNTLKIVK